MCFPMVNLRVQGTRTSMSGACRAEMDLTVLEDVRRRGPWKVTEPTHPLTGSWHIYAGYNSVPCGMDEQMVSPVPKTLQGYGFCSFGHREMYVWLAARYFEPIGNSRGRFNWDWQCTSNLIGTRNVARSHIFLSVSIIAIYQLCPMSQTCKRPHILWPDFLAMIDDCPFCGFRQAYCFHLEFPIVHLPKLLSCDATWDNDRRSLLGVEI